MKKRPEYWERMAAQGKGPLANEPELWPAVQDEWEAWHRLTSSRPVGFGGVGGIPFGAVDRYATRYAVEDFERFHYLLLAMDAAYMEHIDQESERKRNGG